MTDSAQLATKQDVEEIVHRVVGDVVGGIVGNAMQLISEQFDQQDVVNFQVKSDLASHKAANQSIGTVVDWIENKLDATIDTVDKHSQILRRLQSKAR